MSMNDPKKKQEGDPLESTRRSNKFSVDPNKVKSLANKSALLSTRPSGRKDGDNTERSSISVKSKQFKKKKLLETPYVLPIKPQNNPPKKKPLLVDFIETNGQKCATYRKMDFSVIDNHAVNSGQSQKSVEELVEYFLPICQQPVQKARAVFKWITHFISLDITALLNPEQLRNDADDVFERKIAGPEGYANLCVSFATAFGLECKKIKGYAKGYSSKPGKIMEHANHVWNAIKLEGEWYFMDCCWGSGHVKLLTFDKVFKDHYFLTPPKQFIFDHFPVQSDWQLLSPTISKYVK